MDHSRFPSFLISVCLHLGVAALVLWWPAPMAVPELSRVAMVTGMVTIGAQGKSIPGAQEAIPEAQRGRPEVSQPVQKPVEEQPPARTVAQVENPVPPEPRPEIKPIEKPVAPEPKPEVLPIPRETEKAPEKPTDVSPPPEEKPLPPEKKEEPEEPPKTETSPEKPDTVKEPEKVEKTEPPKKPEPQKPQSQKKPEKVDIDILKELDDLAKQEGIATGSRQGRGPVRQGRGNRRSAADQAVDALAKEIGGAGDDSQGVGPGGRGGHGMGRIGGYQESIIASIRPNWSNLDRADGKSLFAVVNIAIDTDGTILGARLLTSSGDTFFDSMVMNSLRQTVKLEPPPTPEQRNVTIRFTP